uniref:Uncharacterized protein n=1 Tax=Arundo donax TaxID=35708 RepID=A0A0A9C185_ARUDO
MSCSLSHELVLSHSSFFSCNSMDRKIIPMSGFWDNDTKAWQSNCPAMFR